MGCNVCCSISNISIRDGDKAVFIPLIPHKDYIITRNHPDEYHLVGNLNTLFGTNHYFNIVTLPIFGEYDFYWGLKNIEENLNTSIISKTFQVDIDEFVSVASQSEDDRQYDSPKQDTLDTMGGMFILREIYDFMCSGSFGLGRGKIEMSHITELVGRINLVDAASDSQKDSKNILVKNSLEQMLPLLNPFKNNNELRFEIIPFAEELYRVSLKKGDLLKEFLDVFTLERVMFHTNRFFFPAMNGEQEGDPIAEKFLLEKSLEIVKRKLEDR